MNVTTVDETTSVTTTDTRLTSTPPLQQKRRSVRRHRYLTNAAALALAAVLLVWTLMPIYHMVMVALESKGDVFSEHIWPTKPSLESFGVVLTQSHWYLEHFWRQFGNSFYIGVMTTLLTLLIGQQPGDLRLHGDVGLERLLLELRELGDELRDLIGVGSGPAVDCVHELLLRRVPLFHLAGARVALLVGDRTNLRALLIGEIDVHEERRETMTSRSGRPHRPSSSPGSLRRGADHQSQQHGHDDPDRPGCSNVSCAHRCPPCPRSEPHE